MRGGAVFQEVGQAQPSGVVHGERVQFLLSHEAEFRELVRDLQRAADDADQGGGERVYP